MPSHTEHTSLEGYHPSQLLHDGCPECEARAKRVDDAISKLDPERFVIAWQRSAQRQLHGLRDASRAEMPMLDALSAVQVQLERRGLPIGLLP